MEFHSPIYELAYYYEMHKIPIPKGWDLIPEYELLSLLKESIQRKTNARQH